MLAFIAIPCTLIFSVILYIWLNSLDDPNVPGPKGHTFSGNTHELPREQSWRTFAEWGVQFGPVVHFRSYLRRFVVLNTADAVNDLLEKRSALYSDRPMSWMLFNLCGREMTVFNISSLHPRHRKYRRLMHAGLSSSAIEDYWPLMQKETQEMIQGFWSTPQLYEEHIRRNAGAVIMLVAYGYTVKGLDDEFIALAKETSQITGQAMAPGWLVDSFPILRFMPLWLPGAGFKRQALSWKKRFDNIMDIPFTWAKNQIADGKAVESFTSKFLDREDGTCLDPDEEDVVKWCASGLYSGAADTTVSAILSFVKLIALHPDVQLRAQAEIDEKLGTSSLPSLKQLDDLHYLNAIMKEVLRFAPVGPLALPHKLVQDDEYMGQCIRKDTTVIPNVWAILHDARTYPNPEVFDPDRFMNPTTPDSEKSAQPDPCKFSFGFGARACPGRQFAEKSLLLSMVGVLSGCNIEAAKGMSVDNIQFTTGHTSHIKGINIVIDKRH